MSKCRVLALTKLFSLLERAAWYASQTTPWSNDRWAKLVLGLALLGSKIVLSTALRHDLKIPKNKWMQCICAIEQSMAMTSQSQYMSSKWWKALKSEPKTSWWVTMGQNNLARLMQEWTQWALVSSDRKKLKLHLEQKSSLATSSVLRKETRPTTKTLCQTKLS